jgi:hypothetical protein
MGVAVAITGSCYCQSVSSRHMANTIIVVVVVVVVVLVLVVVCAADS